MKKVMLLALAIVSLNMNAQKLNIDWGRELKSDSKYFNPIIIGEDKENLYAYDLNGDELILEKVDKKNLKRKYSKTLELPSKGKQDYDFEGLSFINGKYVLFGSTYIRKKKEIQLMAFTIDAKTARYEDEIELFSNEVEKKRRRGDFDVVLSKDNSKMLIHYSAYYRKKEHTKEEFKLLNSDLEIVLEKSQIIKGKENRGRGVAQSFIVDDEGSVYFSRGNEIVVYDANQDYEEWSQPIELDEIEAGAFITDFLISLNVDNDMVLVGSYYTTDSKKTNEKKRRRDRREGDTQVEGMMFMKIDGISKETVITKLSRFEDDFIDQFKSKRDVKKGRDAEVNSTFSGGQFFYKDDGGVVMLTERKFVNYTTDDNGRVVGEHHYYLELLSFNFSAEGDMVWANRIPKEQLFWWRAGPALINYGSYGVSFFTIPFYRLGHYSYIAGLSEGNLYIVFNDHKKNKVRKVDSKDLRTMSNVKKSIPTVVSIDLETGKKSKKSNPGLVSGGTRLKTSTFYQANQQEPLYILSARKKDYKYGKLDLNNLGKGKKKKKR